MRKGRSSRRSRSSRPLVGAKPAVDVLSTGSVASPHGAGGVSPSDPPPSTDPLHALETLERKDQASVAEEENRRSESQRSLTKTLTHGSMSEPPEHVVSPEPARATPEERAAADAVDEPTKPVVETPAHTNETSGPALADSEAHAGAGSAAIDEQFFSEGDVGRHLERDAPDDDALTVPNNAKRKSEPHIVERRARFTRYVKWAVAGAAIVCIAALAQTMLSSKTTPAQPAVLTMEAQPASPKAATTAVVKEPSTADVPAAAPEPTPSAPTVAEPASSEAAEPAAPAIAEPKAASEPTAAEPTAEKTKPKEVASGDAAVEKTKARRSLEKGKIGEAIEAGERSVKLDPTDGEAWLLLGASYQEKGNMVDARRAYAACVKEATKGPRLECQKMLR